MTAATAGDGTSELVVVPAGAGNCLQGPAGRVTVKLGTGRSNGTMSVLEFRCDPRSGPALHTHLREDELWYVILAAVAGAHGIEIVGAPLPLSECPA